MATKHAYGFVFNSESVMGLAGLMTDAIVYMDGVPLNIIFIQ